MPPHRPIFAWISILDDIEHVLKVHGWDTSKPMHQPLHMRLTANFIARAIKDAIEKLLHLPWAALPSDFQEALCIGCYIESTAETTWIRCGL